MRNLVLAAATAALMAPFAATGAMAEDWTGPYIGFGVGQTDVDGPGAVGGDDMTYGLHAGYDWDFGDFVLGGELEYDRADIGLNVPGAEVDNIARVKLRGGYDLGRTLVYGVLGAARLNTSLGDDNGFVYGLGVAYKMTDQLDIGGEVLRHEFNNFASTGSDYDADSVNIRASFRF